MPRHAKHGLGLDPTDLVSVDEARRVGINSGVSGVMRYRTNAGATFSLDFVWRPNDRRPILTDGVAERPKVRLTQKAAEFGAKIHVLAVLPDHVNLFVQSDPTRAAAHLAA